MKLERRKAYNPKTEWSKNDEKLLLNHLRKGQFDINALSILFPGRTLPSIRSKVRKLRIKFDIFGSSYRSKKEEFTSKIAQRIHPSIVFDAYAGAGHQTFKWLEHANTVFACDIMKSKLTQFHKQAEKKGFKKLKKRGPWEHYKKGSKKVFFYHGDAVAAAAELKVRKVNIDTVDLDTCGSTLPTLPILLTLLKPKHLLITHGEFHSMRFQREDVLRRLFTHRDIRKSPLPLDVDQMSKELNKAVKVAAFRAHNETKDSFWPVLKATEWLGSRFHGMLRRYYKLQKPSATSDCLNRLMK